MVVVVVVVVVLVVDLGVVVVDIGGTNAAGVTKGALISVLTFGGM